MATYKGIQGYSVQTLASDPSPTASVVGQLWFNSTSSTYKIAVAAGGAWASGGTMITPRSELAGAVQGTQSAGLIFGGMPNPTGRDLTESYDGTSWTEVNDLVTGRAGQMGAGTQAAGLCFGGYTSSPGYQDLTENWDGTSWTEVNDLNTPRR